MTDNKNVIIAIVLSLIILLGWNYLIAEPMLEDAMQQQQSSQQIDAPATGVQAPAASANANGESVAPTLQDAGNAPVSPSLAATQSGQQTLPRDVVLEQDNRIEFANDLIQGSIRLKGARIDDLKLLKFNETLEEGSDKVTLLSPSQTSDPWFVDFGWLATDQSLNAPNSDTIWTAPPGAKLSAEVPLELTWDNGQGLLFQRTITLDESYLFTITDKVENKSTNSVNLLPYGIIARHGTPETSGMYLSHEGLIGVLGDELQEIDYDDLQDDGRVAFENTKGWLGITDKYWAVTLMPSSEEQFTGLFRTFNRGNDYNYQSEYIANTVVLPAGQSTVFGSRIFAGAKESIIIDAYKETQNIDRFDLLIDWGWFYFLTKPMFSLLHFLFGVVGNFGIAILIITVLVKLIFFPLANKSYKSMAAMKKLTPEMTRMRERYKDDKMKLQQEMMALYKKEKVNPAAGCWPMLIQIPFFFALYKVLFVTIEMRHAPFFGWIQDLAAPDPTTLFNLFGLIPFDPPSFLMIGVWPLLMGITMFLQMRLNPPPPDKTQQMIFNLMPLFFTFLLATFPAGLLIYWTWNNILSIIQQAVIMKRQGVKIELMDNLKSTFRLNKKDQAEE